MKTFTVLAKRWEHGWELDIHGVGVTQSRTLWVAEAREAVGAADSAMRDAAARSRRVAKRLHQAGLSGRDIAKVLEVTPQRVSQLLKTGT